MMARIRGKDTCPEVQVRKGLHALGMRFRKNDRRLPGTPDVVLPKYRAVVLVHGCFWHRHEACKFAYMPKSRTEFWTEKFRENVVRDRRQRAQLEEAGWSVYTVWECEIRNAAERPAVVKTLASRIQGAQRTPKRPRTASSRRGRV
jgi:DNA mismatch endonuclease (patch repair protein)